MAISNKCKWELAIKQMGIVALYILRGLNYYTLNETFDDGNENRQTGIYCRDKPTIYLSQHNKYLLQSMVLSPSHWSSTCFNSGMYFFAADFHRVVLTAIDDNEVTSYINAVHIPVSNSLQCNCLHHSNNTILLWSKVCSKV